MADELRNIRDILEWFMDTSLTISGSTDDVEIIEKELPKLLDQITAEIKSLIKSKLLLLKKELIKCPHGEIGIECESCAEQNKLRRIYNSALAKIEKIMEEL